MCHDPTVWKKRHHNTFAQLELNLPEHNLPAREKTHWKKAAFWHEVKVMCCLPKCLSIGSAPLPSLSFISFTLSSNREPVHRLIPHGPSAWIQSNSFLFFFAFLDFIQWEPLQLYFRQKASKYSYKGNGLLSWNLQKSLSSVNSSNWPGARSDPISVFQLLLKDVYWFIDDILGVFSFCDFFFA